MPATFDVSLLTYCVTSNHPHLLVVAENPEAVSGLMQRLEGEFAAAFNTRKRTDLDISVSSDGTWTVRERELAYV